MKALGHIPYPEVLSRHSRLGCKGYECYANIWLLKSNCLEPKGKHVIDIDLLAVLWLVSKDSKRGSHLWKERFDSSSSTIYPKTLLGG